MSDQPPGTDWWLASDGKWYPPSAPPPPPSPPPPRVDPLAGWLVTGGAAAVVVGAFLPWAKLTAPLVGTLSKPGTDGDGLITLIGGIIAGAVGVALLRGSNKRSLAIASLVVSAMVLAVAVYDVIDLSSFMADAPDLAAVSIGAGLWITILGAGAAVAGSVLWLRRSTSGGGS